MNPMSWLIITTSIMLSTTMITSTTHWLMTWVCLEINTLSMIPIISKPNHPRATEAATKYYLTQTMASTAMLFAATTNALNTSNWDTHLTTEPMATTIITMALMMKMAAAPFHLWLPDVSQGTTTMTALTILTWQKIAPLMIMLTTHNKINTTLVLTSAVLSIMVGGLGSLNQTQLRKLMAFSSIAHTGWIMATITTTPNISTLTFTIYTMTTIPTFLLINFTTSTTIKDLGIMWTNSPYIMTALSMTMLSMGGLPPLSGFMPKWLILNNLTSLNMIAEATLMAMASLLSLYVYMRLVYMSSMTLPPHTTLMSLKWRTPNKKHHMTTSMLTTMTALILPLSPNM
uniref:NADH-ubiquinone oxidoreductase chain 2 n=1 Tax=Euprepiophis perlaceus TaxID=1410277 RepID=A0A067YSG6_9SAUR|nr:NADH dehydrogenase subunit 2 [Euprepiophis perlaceus]AHG24485.1 NADH dehydrogenase subunit 2 [Euprepiophis perlaceus]AHH24455.1 NADH dehydrogenase subunit 2 [Euprepiophis perlaceus]